MPIERIPEVPSWCALQALTGFHEDSLGENPPSGIDERGIPLLATARYPGDSWLRRSLPNGRRWTRAMKLISEADPDSLAPLEHQLRSSELRPATSIGSSSCSEESRQEIVNRVIDLRSSLMKSELSLQSLIPPVSSPADSCFTSRPKTCRMDYPGMRRTGSSILTIVRHGYLA